MASNKVNVLSLFDGISCGQQALERLGVEVGKYYASEIDKYAISITQKNYPDTIQLGDVAKWHEWDIDWGFFSVFRCFCFECFCLSVEQFYFCFILSLIHSYLS